MSGSTSSNISILSKRNFDTQHFQDGLRTIDYILVYSEEQVLAPEANSKLRTFIGNLEAIGLEFECEYVQVPRHRFSLRNVSFLEVTRPEAFERTIFVKVHASEQTLMHFAKGYKIDLECENYNYEPDRKSVFHFRNNELTYPNPSSDTYKRAPDSVSGDRSTTITKSERIMVISELLKNIQFGPKNTDYGIKSIIKQGILNTAFPYHDGPCKWTSEGPLNDRQLLARYWANLKSYWKKQPLNLINKYYGSEVAFYFAWMDFYSDMLLPIAVLGVISFLYGLFTINPYIPSEELCNSNIILCPPCADEKLCHYQYLKDSCLFMRLTRLFDNVTTHTLAFITSCWAIIFVQKWRQKQEILKLKWNLMSLETDTTLRKEYIHGTTMQRRSSITGRLEPYIPIHVKWLSVCITCIACIIIIILSMIPITAVILCRMSLRNFIYSIGNPHLRTSASLIVSVVGSIIIVIFIQSFALLHNKLAKWLTEMEKPRTESDFNDLFVYKRFTLSFVNHYLPVLYLAFFKGKFFTYPGQQKHSFGRIQGDLCDPAGCFIDLGIQLFIIMCIESSIRKAIMQLALKKWLSKQEHEHLPEWEIQFNLLPTGQSFFTAKYLDSIIQYGFIIFFGASFPIAFLFAYFNNLHEIRLNANRLVWKHQRPIPKRVAGIGAWKTVLYFQTCIGITIQAMVIAFTSQLVPRELYRARVDRKLRGYINSTLSIFAIADYNQIDVSHFNTPFDEKMRNITSCYYPGYRHPYFHPQKYETTSEFLLQLLVKFIVVFIFEHLVAIMAGLIAASIPLLPYSVKTQLNIQQQQMKESRIQILNETYTKKIGKLSTDENKKLILPFPKKVLPDLSSSTFQKT